MAEKPRQERCLVNTDERRGDLFEALPRQAVQLDELVGTLASDLLFQVSKRMVGRRCVEVVCRDYPDAVPNELCFEEFQ